MRSVCSSAPGRRGDFVTSHLARLCGARPCGDLRQCSVGLPDNEDAHATESMAPDDLHRLASTRMERVTNSYLATVITGSMWRVRQVSGRLILP